MRTFTLLRTGAIIALGLTITPAVYAASFSDVSDSPNKTAIQFLKTKGMIHGYGNGTFKPNTTINRAELSKILVTATGVNPSVDQYHDCFSDVKKEWFAPFVCYAKEKGWVAGYGDNTFRPANLVSTVEAIKMILQAQGIAVSVSANDTAFSDVDFNAWYASYVATANRKGLLEIAHGRLNVNANMKRGAIAEMMYRSLFIKALGAAKFNDGLALGMHAQELGITTQELKDELDDGKTLQQIAQERGVTLPLPTENHGDWVRSSNESSKSSSSSSSTSSSSVSSSHSSSSENESQAPVVLGAASTFGVLAGSTVTNTGLTEITGDVGVSPGSSITGFAPGVVEGGAIHIADLFASQAQLALTVAYNNLAGRSVNPVSVSGNLGGSTLSPGLYKSSSSLEISSGDLTLDAKGNTHAIFIFQTASTLNVTIGRRIVLTGGAKASNIFWQVGSSATIGTNAVFKGSILADQSISLLTGASVDGRLLARIGAVTLQSNVVTVPTN